MEDEGMADRYRVLGWHPPAVKCTKSQDQDPRHLVKTISGNIQKFRKHLRHSHIISQFSHFALNNGGPINVASFNDHVRHSLCVCIVSNRHCTQLKDYFDPSKYIVPKPGQYNGILMILNRTLLHSTRANGLFSTLDSVLSLTALC